MGYRSSDAQSTAPSSVHSTAPSSVASVGPCVAPTHGYRTVSAQGGAGAAAEGSRVTNGRHVDATVHASSHHLDVSLHTKGHHAYVDASDHTAGRLGDASVPLHACTVEEPSIPLESPLPVSHSSIPGAPLPHDNFPSLCSMEENDPCWADAQGEAGSPPSMMPWSSAEGFEAVEPLASSDGFDAGEPLASITASRRGMEQDVLVSGYIIGDSVTQVTLRDTGLHDMLPTGWAWGDTPQQ